MQLLDRALTILELFEPDRPEWSTTDAAHAVELPIPTAHRILKALEASGYLVRDPLTKRFSLGPASLQLGQRAEAVIDLDQLAGTVLERLTLLTDETALMTVPTEERDGAVCRRRVECSRPIVLSVAPDRVLPLHAGAMQRALLAFLPDDQISQVLEAPLVRLCRATITDPDLLWARIEDVRARGWAISLEETDPGVWGVAVPLIGSDGDPVAALGLAGPSQRLSSDAVRHQVATLEEQARRLAERVGYVVPEVDLTPRRRGARSRGRTRARE